MRTILIALLTSGCGAASAQPVFFDDFDGDRLLPHWRTVDPSHWEHNVSGGMLHVTDLFFPSVPKLEANNTVIAASHAPLMDFRMDVWMGWENPTEPFNELIVSVIGPERQIINEFGMRHLVGEPPEIIAAVTTGAILVPAPSPGMYQFTITRTGAQFDYHLEGEHLGSLPDTFGTQAAGVRFFFSKPFPGEMNPYHIDRVRVIPTPSSLLVPTVLAVGCMRRRRRCSVRDSSV